MSFDRLCLVSYVLCLFTVFCALSFCTGSKATLITAATKRCLISAVRKLVRYDTVSSWVVLACPLATIS